MLATHAESDQLAQVHHLVSGRRVSDPPCVRDPFPPVNNSLVEQCFAQDEAQTTPTLDGTRVDARPLWRRLCRLVSWRKPAAA